MCIQTIWNTVTIDSITSSLLYNIYLFIIQLFLFFLIFLFYCVSIFSVSTSSVECVTAVFVFWNFNITNCVVEIFLFCVCLDLFTDQFINFMCICVYIYSWWCVCFISVMLSMAGSLCAVFIAGVAKLDFVFYFLYVLKIMLYKSMLDVMWQLHKIISLL